MYDTQAGITYSYLFCLGFVKTFLDFMMNCPHALRIGTKSILKVEGKHM
jgi:hypothetical protein